MEARIQDALDAQWDALEARSPKVRTIRRDFGHLFEEFALAKQAELDRITTSIASEQKQISKINTIKAQRREYEQNLEEVDSSELAKELKDLKAGVSEMDAQILALHAKRNELDNLRREKESIYDSRTAKFRDALDDLDKQFAQLPEPADPDEINRKIADDENQKIAAEAELSAARNGHDLWQQVVFNLDELDREIRGLRRGQLHQISFVLSRKADILESYLEIASKAGWSALIIAIGHELQILHDTMKAIHDTDK